MSYIYTPPYWLERTTGAQWRWSVTPQPSIQEQMGVDPISKLAAAVEKLAEAVASKDKS